jgi:hypothetical protein
MNGFAFAQWARSARPGVNIVLEAAIRHRVYCLHLYQMCGYLILACAEASTRETPGR